MTSDSDLIKAEGMINEGGHTSGGPMQTVCSRKQKLKEIFY